MSDVAGPTPSDLAVVEGSYLLPTPILSFLAILSAMLLNLSPMGAVIGIYKSGTVGQLSFVPFFAMVLNAIAGLWYGVSVGSTPILCSNSFSTCVCIFYLGTFFHFYQRKSELVPYIFGGMAGMGMVLAEAGFQSQAKDMQTHLGIASNVVCIAMYAAPLVKMADVIKKRTTDGMVFTLSLSTFVCSLLWFLLGLRVGDIFIQVPNGLGIILGAMQLSLFVFYPSTPAAVAPRGLP